jgi:hypothetical protein
MSTSADEAFAAAQQQHYLQPPDSYTYCTSGACPSYDVMFATSGADEAYTAPPTGWYPLIFDNTAIFAWTFFYLFVGIFTWLCLPRMLLWYYRRQQTCAAAVSTAQLLDGSIRPKKMLAGAYLERAAVPSEQQQLKEAYIMCRYLPSWLHACLSVYFGTVALLNGNGMVDAPLITYYFVALHSFGYFVADIIVDRDVVYVPHHLIPLIFTEVMLRYHGSLYHAVWLGVLCELGNVICHGTALYCRSIAHPLYTRTFKVVYAITRSLSMVAGIFIVHCDIPNECLWAVGPYIALCIFALYCSNAFAVIAVLRDPDTRATTIGVSAGSSCFSVTSLCSFGSKSAAPSTTTTTTAAATKSSVSDHRKPHLLGDSAGVIVAQREPTVSPYIPSADMRGGTGVRWKINA